MEENAILNEEENRTNQIKKAKLEELIRSGDAILMAGAGVTANLYCSWPKLMDKFQDLAIEVVPGFLPRGSNEDFLQFADRVKIALGDDRYFSTIYDEFRDKPTAYEEFHKTIVSMPFRGFTTTNYDHVLDSALVSFTGKPTRPLYIDKSIQKREILDFLKSLNFNGDPTKRVMHLHGSYAVSSSIVLSATEYQDKYGFKLEKPYTTLLEELQQGQITQAELDSIILHHGLEWTMHRKLLWSLLATRRVVFMGFSVKDPYFEKMLFSVREDLNTYNDDIHYVLMRITREEKDVTLAFSRRLKLEYGLETVFFPDDDTFTGFGRCIASLGEATLLRPAVDMASAPSPAASPTKPGTRQQYSSANGMEWLKSRAEAINKKANDENK